MPNVSQNTTLPLDQLYLDPENYRFRDNEYFEKGRAITNPNVQRIVFNIIVGNIDGAKNYPNISDLLVSFRANGYIPVDKIQVQKVEEGVFKVLEGNRRIATLKHLKSKLDNGDPIGQMEDFDFNAVPVELYEDNNQVHFKVLMGLKHISGNRKWEAINQAELVKDLIDLGENPYDIADKLGISMTALNRYRRTLALIEEYKIEYKDQFKARMFILFEEVIKSPDIKKFIGWDDQQLKSTNSLNKDRLFNWFSTVDVETGSAIEDLEDDETGTLANNVSKRPPIITSQDEVRELKKIISNQEAIEALEIGGDITSAIEILKQQNSNIPFEKTLRLISDAQDAAFRTIPLDITLSRDEFIKIDRKHESLKVQFGLSSEKNRVPTSLSSSDSIATYSLAQQNLLSEIQIKKYRALENIKISKLTRINIFAGGNNSAKSSILESIYLLSKGSDTLSFNDIICFRRKSEIANFSFRWTEGYLKSMLPTKLSTLISGTNQNISVEHKIDEIEPKIYDSSLGDELFKIESKVNSSLSYTTIFEKGIQQTQKRTHFLQAVYHSSQIYINSERMFEKWSTIQNKNKQSIVIDYLNNLFFKELKTELKEIRVKFDEGYGNYFLFILANGQESLIYDFGDGLQRCFSISLDLILSENGIILIDELENGIHYLNLPKIARFIFDAAVEKNIQVFITTHSLEAMDSFVDIENESVSFHTLKRNKSTGEIRVQSYTGNEYFDRRESLDLEFRS